jgi:hypothetical protein
MTKVSKGENDEGHHEDELGASGRVGSIADSSFQPDTEPRERLKTEEAICL